MWTGFPSPFIQLVLLFGNGVFVLFPNFPVPWGFETKPVRTVHLSQGTGKGSEDLEAVVVFLFPSWSWLEWGSLSVWGFGAGMWHCHVHHVPALSTSSPPFWSHTVAEHKAALSPGPSCP